VKTWSDYVAEAEQYRHYKQRCEQLEGHLKLAIERHNDQVQRAKDAEARHYRLGEAYESAEQRCEQLEAALRFCGEACEEIRELEEPAAEIADVATSAARAMLDTIGAALASRGDQR
jgi:chromosome segregation ATPase